MWPPEGFQGRVLCNHCGIDGTAFGKSMDVFTQALGAMLAQLWQLMNYKLPIGSSLLLASILSAGGFVHGNAVPMREWTTEYGQ